MSSTAEPKSTTTLDEKPLAGTPLRGSVMTLGVALIMLLALGVRLLGNEWGLINPQPLVAMGYELPPPLAENHIIEYYVYDEFSFIRFLGFFAVLKDLGGQLRDGETTIVEAATLVFDNAYAPAEMTATPVSALLFSGWGIAVTWIGNALGWNDLSWQTTVSNTYRAGRFLTAVLSVLVMVPFLFILKLAVPNEPRLWLIGLLLYAFQVANVTNSHWMSYNPMILLFQLLGFLLLLRLVRRLEDDESPWRCASFLGVWLGTCLATKLTTMPLVVLVPLALFLAFAGSGSSTPVAGLLDRDFRRSAAKLARQVQAFIGSNFGAAAAIVVGLSTATYLLWILPALTNKEVAVFAMQEKMLVSDTLEASGSRLGILRDYFFETLPTSFGWYVSVAGALGLVLVARRFLQLDLIRCLLLIWLFMLIVGYTSNPLGLAPNRSLIVGALWVVCTLWLLESIGHRSKGGAILLGGWLSAASLVACVLLDLDLVKDTNGHRTQASAWVTENVEPGSTLILARDSKYHHIDLSHFEAKWFTADERSYRYEYGVPEDFMGGIPGGYAIYVPGTLPPESLVAAFMPPWRLEEPWLHRALRISAGQPLLKKLIHKAPGIEIHRIVPAP